MTAPERIWVVEAEESVSRDETGQLFADYDKAGLTALAKCYEAEPTKYTRTDIHQAALDRIAELEAAGKALTDAALDVIQTAEPLGDYVDPMASLPISSLRELNNATAAYQRAVLAKGDG